MATTPQTQLKNKLETLSAEKKAANLKILDYIKNLALSVNKDISKWNVIKTFGPEVETDGIIFIEDKKEINKRFFAKLEELEKEKEEALKKAEEKQKEIQEQLLNATPEETKNNLQNALAECQKIIVEFNKGIRQQQVKESEKNIKAWLKEIEALQNEINRYQENVLQERRKVDAFVNVEDKQDGQNKLLTELLETIKDGNWINPVYENGFLYLNNKDNVVFKDTKTNEVVSLGKFAVRIDMTHGLNLLVIPFEDNLMVERQGSYGWLHSHAFYNYICWGQAGNTATKLLQGGDLRKALNLLSQLLGSYNDNGGYVTPSQFKKEGRKVETKDIKTASQHAGFDLFHPWKRPQGYVFKKQN